MVGVGLQDVAVDGLGLAWRAGGAGLHGAAHGVEVAVHFHRMALRGAGGIGLVVVEQGVRVCLPRLRGARLPFTKAGQHRLGFRAALHAPADAGQRHRGGLQVRGVLQGTGEVAGRLGQPLVAGAKAAEQESGMRQTGVGVEQCAQRRFAIAQRPLAQQLFGVPQGAVGGERLSWLAHGVA